MTRLAGLLVVGLLTLLMVPAFASAVPAHPFKEIFGSVAQPEFGEPSDITVDQTTGDVYVIDLEDQTLHRFKENGEPAPFSALTDSNVIDGASGEDKTPQEEILSTEALSTEARSPIEAEVAVAPSSAGETAGDIYVTDALNKVIDIFASSGKYLGQQEFGFPCGVAVDSAGTVFVGSYEGEEAVYKLKPTAPGHLSEVAQFPTTTPCQVAAGFGPAAGSVFVASYPGVVTKLNAETGVRDYTVFSGSEPGRFKGVLSADPATGHLYVTYNHEVKEFAVSGAAPEEVSSTTLSEFVHGVGADSASGGFYASRSSSGTLEVFGSLPPLRTVTVAVSGGGEVSEAAGSPVPASGGISGCEESAGSCSAEYYEGEEPELEAVAGSGSEFAGWNVEHAASTTCTGTISRCKIKIGTENVSASAGFVLAGVPESLSVSATGPGSVECEFAHSGTFGVCSTPQPYGTSVKVKATPNLGAELSSLSGAGSASGCSPGGCEFTISQASSVTVEFAVIAHPSILMVFKGGNGKGTVTSLAPHTGIACGSSCEEAQAGFAEGQTVELEETPQPGSVFAGWIGCRHITTTTCQVKLGSPEVEATAVFLIEGKEGINGKEGKEGPAGKEGGTGKEGVAGEEGKEGVRGERGQIGFPGEQGEPGTAGPAGSQGSQGAQGAQGAAGTPGPVGPAGAQGKEGPAGPPAKVTCKVTQAKNKKAKVTCAVKYATQAKSSSVRRSVRWVLVRHGHVVAHGASRGAPGIHLGALRRGRYVLYLAGSHTGTVIHVR